MLLGHHHDGQTYYASFVCAKRLSKSFGLSTMQPRDHISAKMNDARTKYKGRRRLLMLFAARKWTLVLRIVAGCFVVLAGSFGRKDDVYIIYIYNSNVNFDL